MEKQILLLEKQAKIFLILEEYSILPIGKLAKETETTYAFLGYFVKRCVDKGLLTKERQGRKTLVSLTHKGNALTQAVKTLYGYLNEVEVPNNS